MLKRNDKVAKISNNSVIATKKVNKKTLSRWGILGVKNKKKNHFTISNVIEKPSLKKAPSDYAIIGRYILPTSIISELKKIKPGQGGEIHITDAIKKLLLNGEKFLGNIFKGQYLDCGTLEGYKNSCKIMAKEN